MLLCSRTARVGRKFDSSRDIRWPRIREAKVCRIDVCLVLVDIEFKLTNCFPVSRQRRFRIRVGISPNPYIIHMPNDGAVDHANSLRKLKVDGRTYDFSENTGGIGANGYTNGLPVLTVANYRISPVEENSVRSTTAICFCAVLPVECPWKRMGIDRVVIPRNIRTCDKSVGRQKIVLCLLECRVRLDYQCSLACWVGFWNRIARIGLREK